MTFSLLKGSVAPLRELDEVAFLRYASVYRNFNSLDDFEGEIALLRALPFEKEEERNQGAPSDDDRELSKS